MNKENKPTLVFGASTNPERYSYKAIHKLLAHGHTVFGFSNKAGNVNGVEFFTEQNNIENVHTVTLYMNEKRQEPYYNYILSLKPKRIIFNPGAENEEFKEFANAQGIKTIDACTLVMLSIGNY